MAGTQNSMYIVVFTRYAFCDLVILHWLPFADSLLLLLHGQEMPYVRCLLHNRILPLAVSLDQC